MGGALDDGATSELGRVDDAWQVEPASTPAVGVDLPEGWFLVVSDPPGPGGLGGRYLAVRMTDLRVIELTPLNA